MTIIGGKVEFVADGVPAGPGTTYEQRFAKSWLLVGLPTDLQKRLLSSDIFTILSETLLNVDYRKLEDLRQYVINFIPRTEFDQLFGQLYLHANLLYNLFEARSKGHTLESIIERFGRPYFWRLTESPKGGEELRAYRNDPSLTFDQKPKLGLNLRETDTDDILKTAKEGGCCHPRCRWEHAYPEQLKDLGELIAPVEPEVFIEELTESYERWKARPARAAGTKFRVLIPAQSDETTIMGIIRSLRSRNISDSEIRQNFFFTLSDICPTPLLRVYAVLREEGLLDNAELIVNDAFNWAGKGFDFIMADYFLDRFTKEGKLNQAALLSSLLRALYGQGKLVLTLRCGSETNPLTSNAILDIFNTNVIGQLNNLISRLKTIESSPRFPEFQIDRFSPHNLYLDKFNDVRNIVQQIESLLLYRKFREVYPFTTDADLELFVDSVQKTTSISMSQKIERIGERQVKLIVTRGKDSEHD